MPRKLLYRSDLLPYHVTARTNNREVFPAAIDDVWEIFGKQCLFLRMIYGVEFQAFVVMPNHFHLILTVPEHDLGLVMNDFMRSASRSLNAISRRSGHVFGGPYHWSLITDPRYFAHALKYVYRNPVRAKLCEKVEAYPYSTLYGLIGSGRLPFPVHQTRIGLEVGLPSLEGVDQIEWLNKPFPLEAEGLIQRGLRKRIFEKIINRKTGRPHELLLGPL